ncbi:MAG: metallophosphoesterase [Bacteroidales bacterium]|nr:metallophosphoesterase [Bacteroidales bacterium]
MRKIILLLTVSALSYITTSAQSTFTSSLAAKAKGDANIYGVVECDGKPVEGVAVSDGYKIVLTDRKGQYCFHSEKRNGNVFISIPGGYEALRNGNDVVPQFWAELSSDIEEIERHDFALKAVDNDRHVIVALADIHIANHHNDLPSFRDVFVPKLNKELEPYRNAGIPVYSFCLGDSTHELYWYDYLYDIGDFRNTLAEIKYPTPLFNTLGNHDHDGATPCDENTDFNSAAKYRKAFGPTYYSVNIGKAHFYYQHKAVSDRKSGNSLMDGARIAVQNIRNKGVRQEIRQFTDGRCRKAPCESHSYRTSVISSSSFETLPSSALDGWAMEGCFCIDTGHTRYT